MRNFALEGAKLQGTNLDILQVCKTMSGVHFTVQEWENSLDLKLWDMEACWTLGSVSRNSSIVKFVVGFPGPKGLFQPK